MGFPAGYESTPGIGSALPGTELTRSLTAGDGGACSGAG